MVKTLDQIKAYAIRLRKDLDPLLEGKGMGYDSVGRLFDNISKCDDKRSALTYLGGIRERVQKTIFALDIPGKQEPRYAGLSSKLKPFLIKIDTFMSEC